MSTLLLKKIKSNDFERIYEDMQRQFPENELKSFESFVRLLSEKKLVCEEAFDGDRGIGYILYAMLDSGKMWLDYIAVKKEYHSMGYGRKIISLLDNCYLEVEKPDSAIPDTIRRIKFYTSLGAKKLDINYIYPNDKGGLEMDLYYLGGIYPEKTDILNDIKLIFNKLHFDVKDIMQIYKRILIA